MEKITRIGKFGRSLAVSGVMVVFFGISGIRAAVDTVKIPLLQFGHGPFTCFALSPDKVKFAAGADDGEVTVWDIATWKIISRFIGPIRVSSITFSPNGSKILTGSSKNRAAQLWDIASGKSVRLFSPVGDVLSIAYSPDSSKILTGTSFYTAVLWDVATGDSIRILRGHTNNVNSVAFSPDGSKVLTCSDDRSARLWNIDTGDTIRTFKGHLNGIVSSAFSPDGNRILTGSRDYSARLWNTDTGDSLKTMECGNDVIVNSVGFSVDGARLLTATTSMGSPPETDREDIRVWDATTGNPVAAFSDSTGMACYAAYCLDGSKIFTGSAYYSRAGLWDVSGKTCLKSTNMPRNSIYGPVIFSPDGKKILKGSSAELWDAETGDSIMTIQGNANQVKSAAFSPDGSRILTGSDDGIIRLWNASTGTLIESFKGHIGAVNSVAFSPDGNRMLTGSSDGTVRLWKVNDSGVVSFDSRSVTTAIPGFRLLAATHRSFTFSLPSRTGWDKSPSLCLFQLNGRCILNRRINLAAKSDNLLTVDLPGGIGKGMVFYRFQGTGPAGFSGKVAVLK